MASWWRLDMYQTRELVSGGENFSLPFLPVPASDFALLVGAPPSLFFTGSATKYGGRAKEYRRELSTLEPLTFISPLLNAIIIYL